MQVRYYPDGDVLLLTEDLGGRSGGTLRDDFDVILTFAAEGSSDITRVDILNVGDFLPLRAAKGYDPDSDTLTLGCKPKPVENFHVVNNGDFVSYRQWFDDGSEWDVVAVDLKQASKHLAPAIAALPQPLNIGR